MSRAVPSQELSSWMLNIEPCASGLPIPLFSFSSKLIELYEDDGSDAGLTVTTQLVTASTAIVELEFKLCSTHNIVDVNWRGCDHELIGPTSQTCFKVSWTPQTCFKVS